MIAVGTFFLGALLGVGIMAILAAGRDHDTETGPAQGSMTPPADPNDPDTEWHIV